MKRTKPQLAISILVIFIVNMFNSACSTEENKDKADRKGRRVIALDNEMTRTINRPNKTDLGGDGKITKAELVNWAEDLFTRELQRADLTRDGSLSVNELIYARTTAPGAIIWSGMDLDSNGTITSKEFDTFVSDSVNTIMRWYDSNGDKSISRDEFVGEIVNDFLKLDADKNDVIEGGELATEKRSTPRSYERGVGHPLLYKLCGPRCVWTASGTTPDDDIGPFSTPCDSDPSLPYCGSSQYPGCTNEDVSSGSCRCYWPEYCEPW